MAATTEKYLSLFNTRITWTLTGQSGQVVADATEIQVPRTLEKFDRTSGGSAVIQTVLGRHNVILKVMGWNSDNLSAGLLIPGTRLTAFTLLSTESGTPSVLQSDFFTKFPVTGMALGDTDFTLGNDPSKWTTEIICNALNTA